MKKIPTLFEREFSNHEPVSIKNVVFPGMEWVLQGEGIATEKIDGSCCAIIDGKLYRRYDAKRGKKPPVGAIACCDPDPVTGHWPHWVLVKEEKSGDAYHIEALKRCNGSFLEDGTYEIIGPHFQGNPYHLQKDVLEKHGIRILDDVP